MLKAFALRSGIAGVCLLQACAAPQPHALLIQPTLQVRHSANGDAATYVSMGRYHQEKGDLDLALSAYTYAIARDPHNVAARNAAAAIHAQQGRLDQARAMMETVVTENPLAAQSLNNLGYIDYLRGDFGAATREMRQALALEPSNERARNNLRLAETALAARNAADTGVAVASTAQAPAPLAALPAPAPAAMASLDNVAETAAVTAMAEAARPAAVAPVMAVPMPAAQPVAPAPVAVPLITQVASALELVQVNPNVYELKLAAALPMPQASVDLAPLPLAQVALPAVPVAAAQAPLELVQINPNRYELKFVAAQAVQLARLAPAPFVAQPVLRSRVVVANGNGAPGLARRVSGVLGRQGIAVTRVVNELPYGQFTTRIQYREGYREQAEALRDALSGTVVLVASKHLAQADLRLLLGRDATRALAALDDGSDAPVVLAAR